MGLFARLVGMPVPESDSESPLKNSREVLNNYPALYIYPLCFCIALITLLWCFPYVELYKLLVNEWLTFIPSSIKILVGLFLFYFCIHYLIAFFGATMVAAAILRMEEKSYSVFDGLIEVFKSLKYVSAWILFDLIFYPILSLITSSLNNLPGGLDNSAIVADLAYWKLREFAVPIVIFDRLWPYRASQKATDITAKKGLASALGDIGWEFSLIFLLLIGFLLPFVMKTFLAIRGLEGYWFSLTVSYFIFVWIYFVLNKAIRIAQIYIDSKIE